MIGRLPPWRLLVYRLRWATSNTLRCAGEAEDHSREDGGSRDLIGNLDAKVDRFGEELAG